MTTRLVEFIFHGLQTGCFPSGSTEACGQFFLRFDSQPVNILAQGNKSLTNLKIIEKITGYHFIGLFSGFRGPSITG